MTKLIIVDRFGRTKDNDGNTYGYYLENERELCAKYCKDNGLMYIEPVSREEAKALYIKGRHLYREDGFRLPCSSDYSSGAPAESLFYRTTAGYDGELYAEA